MDVEIFVAIFDLSFIYWHHRHYSVYLCPRTDVAAAAAAACRVRSWLLGLRCLPCAPRESQHQLSSPKPTHQSTLMWEDTCTPAACPHSPGTPSQGEAHIQALKVWVNTVSPQHLNINKLVKHYWLFLNICLLNYHISMQMDYFSYDSGNRTLVYWVGFNGWKSLLFSYLFRKFKSVNSLRGSGDILPASWGKGGLLSTH